MKNQLVLDLDSVVNNVKMIQKQSPPGTEIIGMIKGNGYGTDAAALCRAFSETAIELVVVATLDEAIALSAQGVPQKILLLHLFPEEIPEAVERGYYLVANDLSQLKYIDTVCSQTNTSATVHLQFDTGFCRLGLDWKQAPLIANQCKTLPHVRIGGLFTHLVGSESSQFDALTQTQIDRFAMAIASFPDRNKVYIHVANTAAALRWPLPWCNAVRLGIGLFGTSVGVVQAKNLSPALTFSSAICGFSYCNPGDGVSYGHTWTAPRKSRIAIVNAGYFDGIRRALSNRGYVLIKKRRAPIVGIVCMDFTMIDVTSIPEASIGDPVIFFGKDGKGNAISLEEFASWSQTIPHEAIAAIGPRVERVVHSGSQATVSPFRL